MWLAHRSAVVKCSREHVRHAQPSELFGWKDLLGDFQKRLAAQPAPEQNEGGDEAQPTGTDEPMNPTCVGRDIPAGGLPPGSSSDQNLPGSEFSAQLPAGSTANLFVQPDTGERLHTSDGRLMRDPSDPMYKRTRFDAPGLYAVGRKEQQEQSQ